VVIICKVGKAIAGIQVFKGEISQPKSVISQSKVEIEQKINQYAEYRAKYQAHQGV
jgi:hypothetical protein